MIAFGDIYENEDFDEEYAKLELIRSYLHCYQDDWKIDMTHSIIFFLSLLNKLSKSLSKRQSMSLHVLRLK